MAFNLGFQRKCILSPWGILFHPAKVPLKVFSILFRVNSLCCDTIALLLSSIFWLVDFLWNGTFHILFFPGNFLMQQCPLYLISIFQKRIAVYSNTLGKTELFSVNTCGNLSFSQKFQNAKISWFSIDFQKILMPWWKNELLKTIFY